MRFLLRIPLYLVLLLGIAVVGGMFGWTLYLIGGTFYRYYTLGY